MRFKHTYSSRTLYKIKVKFPVYKKLSTYIKQKGASSTSFQVQQQLGHQTKIGLYIGIYIYLFNPINYLD